MIILICIIAIIAIDKMLLWVKRMRQPVVCPQSANEYFDGKRFIRVAPRPSFSGGDEKIQLFSKWKTKLESVPYTIENRIAEDKIKVYFVNHSTFLLQIAGLNILTDPIYGKIAGYLFLGVKRKSLPGIAFEDLPPIDLVLLSHNHYDHMDIPTLKKIHRRDHPRIITPLGNDIILYKHQENFHITTLGIKESFVLSNGLKITLHPSYHYSSRGLFDYNKALWGSFVLEYQGKKIFFAGDTGFLEGKIFKDLKDQYGSFDLSFISIGAYRPRHIMKSSHVSPHEAVLIHQIINSKQSLAMHFGTFKLSNEECLEPIEDLNKAKAELGVEASKFIALKLGESFEV